MPIGLLSKLYINAGTYDAPNWSEVDLVSDLKLTASWNEGEGSARREQVQVFEPTNMNLALDGKLRKQIDDAVFLFLRAAHITRAPLDVLVLDGKKDVTGSDGFRFMAKLMNWDEDQGLQNVLFKDFTLKPCLTIYLQRPAIALVIANVLTFAFIGG